MNQITISKIVIVIVILQFITGLYKWHMGYKLSYFYSLAGWLNVVLAYVYIILKEASEGE